MALKTLDNSLDVLKYFTKQNPVWGVRELAKEINVSHSIIHRILSTYEKHGFLVQNPETQKYELGIKFLEYGRIVQDKLQLSDVIFPVMKKVSEETGESVFLTWLDGCEAVCVEIAESSQSIKFAVSVGSRTPIYVGASNKVMMAFLPKEKQETIMKKGLKPVTENTVVDPEKLSKDLERIRNNGWCFSVGEYSDSVFGLGVPLFNHKKEIIASLTIAGPEYRMPESKVPEALSVLIRGREEIQNHFNKLGVNCLEMWQAR
jgi:DNA-binding IclR family transcriptional regulator